LPFILVRSGYAFTLHHRSRLRTHHHAFTFTTHTYAYARYLWIFLLLHTVYGYTYLRLHLPRTRDRLHICWFARFSSVYASCCRTATCCVCIFFIFAWFARFWFCFSLIWFSLTLPHISLHARTFEKTSAYAFAAHRAGTAVPARSCDAVTRLLRCRTYTRTRSYARWISVTLHAGSV